MPMKIALLCGHDNKDMIRPIPAATWTVSAQGVTFITFSDSLLRVDTNDQLLIDNDVDPIQFSDDLRGAYTCTMINSQGSDTKTTNIGQIFIIILIIIMIIIYKYKLTSPSVACINMCVYVCQLFTWELYAMQ